MDIVISEFFLFFIRALVLIIVGIFGILGLIICAPFPSFWRDVTERGSGYAKEENH